MLLKPFRIELFELKAIWNSLVEEHKIEENMSDAELGRVPKDKMKAWVESFVISFHKCDKNVDGRLNPEEAMKCAQANLSIMKDRQADISLGDDEGDS
jgi:hypothetical protein